MRNEWVPAGKVSGCLFEIEQSASHVNRIEVVRAGEWRGNLASSEGAGLE